MSKLQRTLIEHPYSSNPATSATAQHFAARGFQHLPLFWTPLRSLSPPRTLQVALRSQRPVTSSLQPSRAGRPLRTHREFRNPRPRNHDSSAEALSSCPTHAQLLHLAPVWKCSLLRYPTPRADL